MGRRKLDVAEKHVNKIKTKCWYNYLLFRLRKKFRDCDLTHYKLIQLMEDHGVHRDFKRYKTGENTPETPTIEIIESLIPGSEIIFNIGPCGFFFWDAFTPSAKQSEIIKKLIESVLDTDYDLTDIEYRLFYSIIIEKTSGALNNPDYAENREFIIDTFKNHPIAEELKTVYGFTYEVVESLLKGPKKETSKEIRRKFFD